MADKDLIQQYRFRVRTGAGQEVVSPIATVSHPSLSAQQEPTLALAWAEVPVKQILVAVKGQQQGNFQLDSGFTERPGSAPHQFSTDEFSFAIKSPRDAASGLPTGRRMHLPVTFSKNNGPSTPQFYQALVNNEALPTVIFDCYGLDQQGQTRLAHSVKLTNASVATVGFTQADVRDPKTVKLLETLNIALTFQKIEVNHGGKVMSDTWE